MGLLSLAIWTPIAFGLLLLFFGRDNQAPMVRWIALVGALAGLAVTFPLFSGFDTSTAAAQFVEKSMWIERFNVHYHLGLDGLSFWFVPLTAFITVIVVVASWENITKRVNQYFAAFLILSGIMIGVGFHLLNGLFSNLGVINGWIPAVAALTPSIGFLLAAMGMMWWVERR